MSAKFCNVSTTSVLCISRQHLNHPNLLVRSIYQFHMYFHVRIITHYLGILLLSHEDGVSKNKRSYTESACYTICDDYAANSKEI